MSLFLLLLLASGATPSASLLGDWQSPTSAVVRVYTCGPSVCLKLVQLPPDAPTRFDIHNPNSALHTRALCSLDIGTGFHQDDPSRLTGGHLYDPEAGKTYKGTITLADNTLKLHGYIGISLLGRTETWHRVNPVATCK